MYFSTTATLVRLFCYCRVFHGSVFSNSQINMKTVSIASTFFMYACFDVCYEPRLRCPFWVTCQMVHLKTSSIFRLKAEYGFHFVIIACGFYVEFSKAQDC